MLHPSFKLRKCSWGPLMASSVVLSNPHPQIRYNRETHVAPGKESLPQRRYHSLQPTPFRSMYKWRAKQQCTVSGCVSRRSQGCLEKTCWIITAWSVSDGKSVWKPNFKFKFECWMSPEGSHARKVDILKKGFPWKSSHNRIKRSDLLLVIQMHHSSTCMCTHYWMMGSTGSKMDCSIHGFAALLLLHLPK